MKLLGFLDTDTTFGFYAANIAAGLGVALLLIIIVKAIFGFDLLDAIFGFFSAGNADKNANSKP